MVDERVVAETIPLPRGAAVELASAWLWSRATRLGVRSLIIKGPIAERLGLRARRSSADVDLLVEPGRADEIVSLLEAGGWRERFSPSIPWVMEFHSRTFVHDRWPIDLDIHHYWPGFLKDRADVFEALWSRREAHSMAGILVDAPDAACMTLILALHSLRDPQREKSQRELPLLVTHTLESDSPSMREDILSAAFALGAEQTARPFLTDVGLSVPEDTAPGEALRRWHLMTGSTVQTRAWMVAITEAPLRARPRLLFGALFPPASELRGQHPDLPPGRRGLLVGWSRRLLNGARDLLPSIRDVARYRRGKGSRND